MAAARFTEDEARAIGGSLGIDWVTIDFDQFRLGLEVELEHGTRDPATDVTGDDPIKTGKIALAHLKEIPDYYTRLAALESPVAQADGDSSPPQGGSAGGAGG